MGSSRSQERKKKNKARRAQLEERKTMAYRRRAGLGPDAEEVFLASSFRRFFALMVDQVFFGICTFFFLMLISNLFAQDERVFGESTTPNGPPLFVVFLPQVLFGFLYVIPRIKLRGQTIGRRVLKIIVINAEGTGLLSWKKAFQRWFLVWGIPAALAIALSFISDNAIYQFCVIVGYLLLPTVSMAPAIWNEHHQGLHDRIAGSVVIRETPLVIKKAS